jgi:EAL domain-containing protein (putative c-di-GMP-specific phosphodiesterase class I)
MDVELRTRAALEADLRRAISSGEIRPHYQPFFDLANRRLLGFEVLARWEHPMKGLLLPDLFIPNAEDSGLIGDLTAALLREACRDARAWPHDVTLAVNISPSQLQDRWLPQRLLAIMTETGFPPGRLEVEITENALVNDMDIARGVLTALQNVGVKIALDDFGTGYSSLYHLRELKFDKIKIDRSFVLTMQENGESEKIVNAIVGLSRSLGLVTTAEGIETHASLDQLTELGCDFGQGYHFGAAMPSAEAARLVSGDMDLGEALKKTA